MFGVLAVATATMAAVAAKVLATTEDQLHDPVPVPPVIMPFSMFFSQSGPVFGGVQTFFSFCYMIMRHEAPDGPYLVSFCCCLPLYTKGHFTLLELEGP